MMKGMAGGEMRWEREKSKHAVIRIILIINLDQMFIESSLFRNDAT